jgi:antirestriction protein ArdC
MGARSSAAARRDAVILKGNRKAIFTAASVANKAADFLMAFSES